ncbi:DUF4395 domain-containing protein [Marinilabiliaceae bacterium ANBcel2]|nr:DUF4395 domain-containing protein [Marinilabiliaceae bacterium ANBcel2]
MLKIETMCPISGKKVNKWIARVNATLTTLLLLLYFFSNSVFIIFFLTIDFALRGFEKQRYSLLSIISTKIVEYLPVEKKMENAGPKFFAARIGWVFSLMVLIAYFFNLPVTANIIAGVFAFFAFLEAAVGFCLACYIYPYFLKVCNVQNKF